MSNSKMLLFAEIICLAVCGFALAVPSWCPDLSPNNKVDFADFAVLADNWGQSGFSLQGDIDSNGTVDIYDLQLLTDWWLADYGCKDADFNIDYTVNFLDFAKLAQAWLTDSNDMGWNSKYDLDDNNSIDFYDLRLFTGHWLETYPEPNDVFGLLKDALANSDIDTALTFIADTSKDNYDEIFQAIGANLPNYAAGMGTLTLVSQDEDTATYEMGYQDGSTTYSFPVVFVKDSDGNWKVYNF